MEEVMEETTEETTEEIRPAGLTEDVLIYLDQLRDSGITNMFGAGPYLEATFDLDHITARAYLLYWIRTFRGTDRCAR